LYGAAPGWLELKGQLLWRFSFNALSRSTEGSTPGTLAMKEKAETEHAAHVSTQPVKYMFLTLKSKGST